MSAHDRRTPIDGVAAALEPAGLDLVAATRADRYDRAVPAEYHLPDIGRPDALVVVVGNTRALWVPFLEWLATDRGRLDLADPLDAYVEERVRDATRRLEPATEVCFAHDPPPRRVAMQRLAELSGLARIAPNQLCIHPEYGPWISLRAAIMVDTTGPPDPAQPPPDPCLGCTDVCREAFRTALEASRRRGPRTAWREWVAVRDACPVGRGHRFADEQLAYHATADREILRNAVRARG
jgi:methylmalonic aciduria homocystinuria type C protein